MSKVDYTEAAKAANATLEEVEALVAGRVCPIYPDEPLFTLRGRGGSLQVRPISKKAQVAKMQAARKAKSTKAE